MKLKQVLFLLILIIGCSYNPKNSTFITPEVKWTNNDEYPSIEDCDEYDTEIARKNCFNSKITSLIYSNIDLGVNLVSKKLNDTVLLSLLIDNQGKISLLNIDNLNGVLIEIPDIELIIRNSLKNIPYLYPATKTNFGIPVSTKFKLPLILKSN